MTIAKDLKTFRFPDRPDREPDDMTSFDHLADTSIIEPLRHYLGNRDTTLITGEKYLVQIVSGGLAGSRYPDLLIAFNANMEFYRRRNAYVIEEQGKPPDFVLEIASRKTGDEDAVGKRSDYAALGIAEYWRFDQTPTGAWHGERLAGDRLVDGQYRPVAIEQLAGGALQGYSRALNLYLRWENGQLKWHNPETGRHIPTFQDERNARIQAEADAIAERNARIQAEARARELEERLKSME